VGEGRTPGPRLDQFAPAAEQDEDDGPLPRRGARADVFHGADHGGHVGPANRRAPLIGNDYRRYWSASEELVVALIVHAVWGRKARPWESWRSPC